ncbi:MAG: hypothetical protein QGF20_16030 [Alphaproteobacteria bacterium]|jgi:hypothetical protein|nr:hypothetical protein [Alphaproteobacteria bacterium]|tara:strand:+ start:234 stop:458 length:225 start_codon:yes stop_codon:yes gene_type:complete
MIPLAQKPLQSFALPFGQEMRLQEVEFAGDVRLLRLRIKEKSRFTIVDLDPATARALADAMSKWAGSQTATGEE